jgi:dCMP deaminase
MDDTLLAIAGQMSTRSTCTRGNAGAVLARRGRILSTGYNGAPEGMPHCEHREWKIDLTQAPPDWVRKLLNEQVARGHLRLTDLHGMDRLVTDGRTVEALLTAESEPRQGCTIAVHAEANAVAFAARYGVALEDTTCYCTISPCVACAQLLIQAGITRVVAARRYRDPEGTRLLVDARVLVNVMEGS